MSVIAARIKDGVIDIACDSIIAKEDLKRNNFKKILQTNKMIVGGCGSAEELSLFFDYAKDHEVDIATTQGVRDFMLEFAHMKELYTGESKVENAYIIAVETASGNYLFEVDGMFVTEVTSYTAIGQGESYALAALYFNHSVQEAVQVAAAFSCYVAEPIQYYYMT